MKTTPLGASPTQSIAHTFDLVANGYDSPTLRFFPMCADQMIHFLRPKPGSKVLDVATGTGAVAIACAQSVGPSGRIQAIDLAENMLDKAFHNSQAMAMHNIDFHTMDASKLEFKDNYFNAVTCGFGLFFMQDIVGTLQHWHRVLQPKGRVVFTSFTQHAFQPLLESFGKLLQDFQIPLPNGAKKMEANKLCDIESCQSALQQAGFSQIQIHTKQMGYHLPNAASWWEICWNTALRAPLSQLSADDLLEFQRAHLQTIDGFATQHGIWLDVETLFAVAEKT